MDPWTRASGPRGYPWTRKSILVVKMSFSAFQHAKFGDPNSNGSLVMKFFSSELLASDFWQTERQNTMHKSPLRISTCGLKNIPHLQHVYVYIILTAFVRQSLNAWNSLKQTSFVTFSFTSTHLA